MSVDFEQELRRVFRDRADSTRFTLDVDRRPVQRRCVNISRPIRWVRPLLAVAAIAAVAVITLAVTYGDGGSPPAAAGDAPLVLDDPLALSLDPLRGVGPVPAGPAARPYLVVDAEALPPGWSIETTMQGALLDFSGDPEPAIDHYRSQATLTTGDGTTYSLRLERSVGTAGELGGPRRTDTVSVDGTSLQWVAGDGVVARLDTPAVTTPATLQAVSEQIPLVAADALDAVPAPRLADVSLPRRVDFEGELAGVHWWATIGCCSLRAIAVGSAIENGAGATSADRLSQPTDDPTTRTDSMIVGIPSAGAIVAGFTDPAATGIQVIADGQVIAEAPVIVAHGAAFFAVPVPDGVRIDTVAFTSGAGDIHPVVVPPLPPDLFGTYPGM